METQRVSTWGNRYVLQIGRQLPDYQVDSRHISRPPIHNYFIVDSYIEWGLTPIRGHIDSLQVTQPHRGTSSIGRGYIDRL